MTTKLDDDEVLALVRQTWEIDPAEEGAEGDEPQADGLPAVLWGVTGAGPDRVSPRPDASAREFHPRITNRP